MRSLVRFTGVVAVLTVSSCGKDATAPGVHPGGLIPDSPWRARAPRMRQALLQRRVFYPRWRIKWTPNSTRATVSVASPP